MLFPSGVFFLDPSLDFSFANCSVHGCDFFLLRQHQSMAALTSGSSCWALAQSMTCIWVLSLADITFTSMELASQWVAESVLYSCSALLPAPEVKLLKTAFMALEDILWGVVLSGHQSSSFSSKTSNTVLSPGIMGTALSTLSASSSERHSLLILL